jgi:hypothetical protein
MMDKFDSDGELIIEIEEIFNIDESGLRTPLEDDFEYEILIEGSSKQR